MRTIAEFTTAIETVGLDNVLLTAAPVTVYSEDLVADGFEAFERSQFFPSHLASQGFFLLRARTQMREVTNILLK